MEIAKTIHRGGSKELRSEFWGASGIRKFSIHSAPGIVVLALYGVYVAAQSVSRASRFKVEDVGYSHIMAVANVVVGSVSLALLATSLCALIPICRRVAAAMTVLALFGYASLCFYNWKTNSTLSFSLLADHLRELQEREAWIVVSDQLGVRDYFVLAAIYTGLWAIEWKFTLFSPSTTIFRHYLLVAGAAGIVWFVVIVWGPVTSEPATLLARSVLGESFRLRQHGLTVPASQFSQFPYVQNSEISPLTPSATNRPHIFVLMIESFNARFVTELGADGYPLMPRFQDAIRKGVWVQPFYGNATYTIKGQEATLTSLPPTLSGNLANTYKEVRFRALPLILREEGYETIFFQAYRNLEFAGTGEFMRRCGFEFVQALTQDLTKTMDPEVFWGWGAQDDAFYDRFFTWLSESDPHPSSSSQRDLSRPLFAFLATISSHSPYDEIPRSQCRAFPNPTSKAEWYANIINQVDRGIGRFLDNLEHSVYASNAIVVITSDHSIPMGEHGAHSLQAGFFEESFRIPCLILWPGKLKPRLIENEPFSQVDIAPTLLDLAGIITPHHFTGRSIFQQTTQPRSAVLVQPYDGLYLVARQAAWKYVFHNATGREFIFDLARDPDERINRFWETPPELRGRLRLEAGRLWLHDHLLAQNRIWPEARTRRLGETSAAGRTTP